MSRRLFLLVAFLALAGAGLWLGLHRSATTPPTRCAEPAPPIDRADSRHHPLSARIRNPDFDARAEVLAVAELVHLCLHALRQSPHRPLGTNAEFTAALTGSNSLGLEYLPPGHPAINSRGELCDRWHRPFLFNPLSAQRVEIRSAGPDGQLFTDDDITVGGPTGFEP